MKNFTKQITNKTLFKPTRWILLALMLLLGTSGAWAAQYIYLKTGVWNVDGARFAAYFYGNGQKWVDMISTNSDGIYYAEIPSGYANVIFVRMNGSTSVNNWDNKWNQTNDLTVPGSTSDSRQYDISGWGTDKSTGSWVTFTVGFRSTTSSHDFGDVEVNTPNASEKNIETNHKGTAFTISNVKESGDNANEFTPTVSGTALNVKYKPTTSGSKTITYTITDAYGIKHTITVTGNGVCPSIEGTNSKLTGFNYVECDKVYVQHSDNGKKSPSNKYLVVRYEGQLPNEPAVPQNGTQYKLNDVLDDGGIVVGVGNSNQTETTIPNSESVYTFALYEYTPSPCLEYSELTTDRYKTTERRTPTVTTADAVNVSEANATLGGKYTATGACLAILDCGIQWTRTVGDKISNSTVSFGVSATFSKQITFTQSGTYYYRAYAKNNCADGSACQYGYGEEKSVTISVCTPPAIQTTSAVYNASTGNIDIAYSITETGGATVHYGVQCRTENEAWPTENLTDANFIKIGTATENKTGTYSLADKAPGVYYVRTYANNGCPSYAYNVGMVYGDEIKVEVPKKDQPTLTLAGVDATYCTLPVKAIELSVKGGAGEGTVTYSIVNEGTTATATINGNQLSITKGGTLKLKATKAADNNYNQAESEVVTVTIYEDIVAGSLTASAKEVCEGAAVTLTLTGNTEGTKITWTASDCDSPAESVANDATQFIANVSKQTCYMVEVSREDAGCPVKIAQTNSVQINTDAPSAISLSATGDAACLGTPVTLTDKVTAATGDVTWYSDEACTDAVVNPESITVNGDATYYAKAQNGVCPATEAVAYSITAKGATISRTPAGDIHPYEVTTFTASKEATWELTANPAKGDELSADDPTFSGKTTAYITKAAGLITTFKGKDAEGYEIKATAEDCETTLQFDVVADPDNCK